MMLVACSGQWLSDTAGREQDVRQPRVPCSIMFAPIVMGGWWVNSDNIEAYRSCGVRTAGVEVCSMAYGVPCNRSKV